MQQKWFPFHDLLLRDQSVWFDFKPFLARDQRMPHNRANIRVRNIGKEKRLSVTSGGGDELIMMLF